MLQACHLKCEYIHSDYQQLDVQLVCLLLKKKPLVRENMEDHLELTAQKLSAHTGLCLW